MSRYYGWPPDAWRSLGWLELMAWVRAMNRERRGGDPDPGSWSDPTSRTNFDELAARREKLRGR